MAPTDSSSSDGDASSPLPSILETPFKIVDGSQSSVAGNPDEIAKLFPNMFGQPSAMLVPSDSDTMQTNQELETGVTAGFALQVYNFAPRRSVESAFKVFETIPERNLVSTLSSKLSLSETLTEEKTEPLLVAAALQVHQNSWPLSFMRKNTTNLLTYIPLACASWK
ncbi:hypothetical protein SESBI_18157 [Sesbania bispinosa]|nr:hypothetical protein SESBI_18157 [Sesbania bispinosa]